MTTTLTARPARLAPTVVAELPATAPVLPPRLPAVRPSTGPAAACPIELRALHTGACTLAVALTGIALDAPCDGERQRAVRDLTRLLLAGLDGTGDRLADDGVRAAAAAVRQALPVFVHDVSAGAPALATACAVLADRLDARAAGLPAHDHGRHASPLSCQQRLHAEVGRARAVVPWFLDAATPAERAAVVSGAPRRVRRALRLGEDRYLRTVALVRG